MYTYTRAFLSREQTLTGHRLICMIIPPVVRGYYIILFARRKANREKITLSTLWIFFCSYNTRENTRAWCTSRLEEKFM